MMTGYFSAQMEQRMQLEDLADSVALPRDSTVENKYVFWSKFLIPSHQRERRLVHLENFDFTPVLPHFSRSQPQWLPRFLHFRSLLTALPSILNDVIA